MLVPGDDGRKSITLTAMVPASPGESLVYVNWNVNGAGQTVTIDSTSSLTVLLISAPG